MKLKDKLEIEIMDLPITDEVIDSISNNLEQIAETFAVSFAVWLRDDKLNTEFWYKEITVKELLEIYKKKNE